LGKKEYGGDFGKDPGPLGTLKIKKVLTPSKKAGIGGGRKRKRSNVEGILASEMKAIAGCCHEVHQMMGWGREKRGVR